MQQQLLQNLNLIESLRAKYKRILFYDASAHKEGGCMQRLQYIIDEGISEKVMSSSLSYGTAVHKFIATLRKSKGDFGKAFSEAITYYTPHSLYIDSKKDFRTLEHLMVTCTLYREKFYKGDLFTPIMNPFSNAAEDSLIEQKFAFPAIDIFPALHKLQDETSTCIILSGTVDEIGMLEAGNICIKDNKTMACNSFFVKMNFEGYQLSLQLMFYRLIVEHLLKLQEIPCFIDAIVLDKKTPSHFVRSDLFIYSDKQMLSFKNGLLKNCIEILESILNNNWIQNYQCCNNSITVKDSVGKCKFFKLCATTDDDIRAFYKQQDFSLREYNPLKFDEQGIE